MGFGTLCFILIALIIVGEFELEDDLL